MKNITLSASHLFLVGIGSYVLKFILNALFSGGVIQIISMFLEILGFMMLALSVVALFKERSRKKKEPHTL